MSYFIMRLQYIQEQSRQTILPGLELFYEHPPFALFFVVFSYDSSILSLVSALPLDCANSSIRSSRVSFFFSSPETSTAI